MGTTRLTFESFEQVTARSPILLVLFEASGLPACDAFRPAYERASDDHPDVTFATIDTEATPELARAFRIRAVPTLLVVKEGVVIFARAGALEPDAISHVIADARALDMDEARRTIADARDESAGVIRKKAIAG